MNQMRAHISFFLVFSLVVCPCLADKKEKSPVKAEERKQAVKIGEGLEAGPHLERIGPIHTGRLARHASESVSITLDRARCFRFVVAGGPGVKDLSLALTAEGREIAGDKLSGKHPQIEWCAPGKTEVKVNITMYDGEGIYALAVFGEKDGPMRGATRVGGERDDFIANRLRQLYGKFAKGSSPVSAVERGNLSAGNEKIFKIRLKHGFCYTIIGAGSPSVKNLDITLVDPGGRELGKDSSKNSFPVLVTDPCPRSTGQYTVKIGMFSGFGQFGIQIYSKR